MDLKSGSLTLRANIIDLFNKNKKKSHIARELGISIKTVQKWVKRNEENGDLRDRHRSGAPRCTTHNEDRDIILGIENNPFTNAREIQRQLQMECSDTTIRRRLHEAGIHHRISAVKHKLSDEHKSARLAFANQYIQKDMNYWSRVIFTDEKTFSSTNHAPLHCWRHNNARYDAANIFEEARSDHVKCNVWGWINAFTVGELTHINGRFTIDQYLEILDEVFLPSVRVSIFPDPERFVFVQDNNRPIHASRRVKQWFEEHQHIIDVLPWPSKGCDLNPIENVWAAFVKDWRMPQDKITKKDLEDYIKTSWENLRMNHIIENSILSIPNRLQAVIEAKGGWTKF
ncbi:UNVERIFIED_CONTAM: hypothetical protein RMT77_015240 [Armadillidium vulgare]